ncbi:MAG: M1 family peptidase [Calditrichaeota bacterium]|nr:MAG: M1 family peptidase [Calditrichota bacterium]MBL1203829.1 M1 family peptidase [Calditrichota bacterium]NOG43660.1 M1 family metallopeptidase [Calditrichota bacterium]
MILVAKIKSISIFLFIISIVISCKNTEKDIHSFANINDIIIEHMDLDLKVDFETHKINGIASLIVNNLSNTNKLVLDSWDLDILKVTLDKSDQEVKFNLGAYKKDFGQPLTIDILSETKVVHVHYKTSPKAQALQWLTPEQTSGKEHPFLFSQSQSIYARTWVPCMDTPSLRFTYTAKVTTDPNLLAVMSASNPTQKNEDGIYHFKMDQPIPTYLLALAVGDIEFQPLGENSGVYAEPSVIEKAVYEFADTPQMIKKAENLYGPYKWGRFDVLVLPPSFPYGGMENPRLTFATPTIIAGDRSLVALIAHELAHSWSGNLVTNATWDDIWLNEGFTTYFEYRIMEELYGRDYATMIEQIGYQDLKSTLDHIGHDHPDTKLAIDLTGRHPEEPVGKVVYEKGELFLRTLEVAYGRDKFDEFLKTYFDKFAFKTMTSDEFAKYISSTLTKETKSTGQAVLVYEWIYGTGLPKNYYIPDSPEFRKVDTQRQSFIEGNPASSLDVSNWTTHHWLHFIRVLPPKISLEQLSDLDKTFNFTNSGNSEILYAWFIKAIEHNYNTAFPALENFLMSVGRAKFVAPLYGALTQSEEGRVFAKEIYKKARPGYHPVTYGYVDGILGQPE